jgi:transposase InsO family protein
VSVRRSRRRALAALIAYLFTRHRGTYGSPRITADLRELGWRVSKNTVAALMAEQRLAARPQRKRRSLTRTDRSARKAPDALKRDFTPPGRPDVRWCGDLTEIPNEEGRFYLANVLDLHSRRCIGFALDTCHDAALACAALRVAIAVRGGSVAGVVFHTDQGGEGEFQWSSQHLYRGGGSWRQEDGRRSRQRANRRRVVVGSGRPIGRCGRRCVRPGGRSPRVRSSARFGG